MKVALGGKCASAYAILMTNNPDKQKIQEIIPQLDDVLECIKMLERKTQRLDPTELPDDFDLFKAKLENNIITYYKTLHKNFRSDLLSTLNEKNSTIELQNALDAYYASIATLNVFKLYFHKVLDSRPVEIRWHLLQGCSQNRAIGSILEDLDAFSQLKQGSLTQNDAERLRGAMINLQFAFEVRAPYEDARGKEQEELALKKGAQQIHIKLTEHSESIVVAGGFTKHAVLYQIKKTDSGTYDLSIINTGDGASTVLRITKKGCSFKSQDVVYTGLTLDDLSESFFLKLLHKKETANNMEEVYEFLDNTLLNHSAKKVKGTDRCLQKKGTCTVKCILEWLKTELGKDLFQDFSSLMFERALQSVEKEAETISPTVLRLLFPLKPEEVRSSEYFSEQLGSLIDAGKQQLELKRLRRL